MSSHTLGISLIFDGVYNEIFHAGFGGNRDTFALDRGSLERDSMTVQTDAFALRLIQLTAS